jgi:hypothetical protein
MATSDLEKRLFDLKLQMNKAKQLNNQAVLAEKKRIGDPKWYQKQHAQHAHAEEAERDPDEALLHETAETVASRTKKRKPGEDAGWNTYNPEALYRAHDRRVDQIGFYPDAYERQKEALGEEGFYDASQVKHKPSDDAKERLAGSLKEDAERRKKFSRRRVFDEEEEVQWINEANRRYGKQLEKSFGEYTREIKSNLERGTAI